MAPVILAAPAVPPLSTALLASAAAGVAILPFITVVAVGSYIVLKSIDMVDDKVDDYLVNRAHRRYGAEQNKNEALNRYLARKGRLGTEPVKANIAIPTPAMTSAQAAV